LNCPICGSIRTNFGALDLPDDEVARRLRESPPFTCEDPDGCEATYHEREREKSLLQARLHIGILDREYGTYVPRSHFDRIFNHGVIEPELHDRFIQAAVARGDLERFGDNDFTFPSVITLLKQIHQLGDLDTWFAGLQKGDPVFFQSFRDEKPHPLHQAIYRVRERDSSGGIRLGDNHVTMSSPQTRKHGLANHVHLISPVAEESLAIATQQKHKEDRVYGLKKFDFATLSFDQVDRIWAIAQEGT
jgi:hypothetical protein